MEPLKIIFMGTAELACASLKALCHARNLRVIAAVSQPDKPKGRDLKVHPTPVKEVALAEGLPVLQPARAREAAFIEKLRMLGPDLIVVAAYGQILPQTILDLPRFGCINVHTSLLPKYRGAAPIQWAILDDQKETGVTIMKMDAGMDTGPIITQATTAIQPTDTGQSLHDRLAKLGGELLIETIPDYVSGKVIPRPQPIGSASHARKITKEDGRINWAQPARVLWNRIRAFNPWPGAYTHFPAGSKPVLLKVWSAEVDSQEASSDPGTVLQADALGIVVCCGSQSLRIHEVQREGGRRMRVKEFLAGHSIAQGTQMRSPE